MATVTPELRQEIDKAGNEPVRIEDPRTKEVFVVLREDVYKKLREILDQDQSDVSLYEYHGDFEPL